MRVISYARVSTVEQAEGGISLDAQIVKMAAYAGLYDLEIIETVLEPGESGKTLNRPGLKRALGLLKAGKADGLLILRLDRLTRSIADWQDLIDAYFGERGSKQLLSVNDSIDTRTAAGRLVLTVLITVAQWERETIGERTRDALQHKIRNGQRVGKVRFGYDLTADGVTLVENAAEQKIIALMRDLRAARYTLRQIAAALTACGILTKEGNTQWQHQTVAYILRRAA